MQTLIAPWGGLLVPVLLVVSAVAEESVPIRDGLVVHLDARDLGKQDERPVARWRNLVDGIGDFVQQEAGRRPALVEAGGSFVVRFDGESYLRSTANVLASPSEVTIFLVAAAHENLGDFPGFLAANAVDQRDYQSGFNVDLGHRSTRSLEVINVEGKGFGGEADLFDGSNAFGTPHLFTIRVSSADRKCRLRVDRRLTGTRDYEPSAISLEELTVGARHYTNGAGAQQVRGALKCDLAELLIYRRALAPDEVDAIENHLTRKHAELAGELPRTFDWLEDRVELVMAQDPPAIQMLVPGFEVHELPLNLTNINNVRFRPDGKLFALGYDGNVYLLRDTDGDGLEDTADLFWKNQGSIRGPIGLLVTPQDYPRGQGVFTPSKGKVSLIVDRDNDDQADEEIVVASGWKEIPQNVDATGIAMDDAGYLYFGLGTANYANAYLIDDQGVAGYDIHSDRGTVQRVSPDFQERTTVCTGIRFPIAFAFNEHGDLFCSEQEGATWLANGNPFDELLHIQPGRHYGFPPRHPRHNPGVIDEPSVFDFAPQHQSTCGMVFNQPTAEGSVFGPAWWRGDALVCGESRGKIWRTKLAKTRNGYVAATQLIACLQMLTVDACVAPNGDLVVACHSGPPDWGTGPTGIGKLFRIRMKDADAARPVAGWVSSPSQIQIAFDRPLDPSSLRGALEQVSIEYGPYVRPGDSFETLVPPYEVVRRQRATPRRKLAVHGLSLTADQRDVIIHTDRLPTATHLAVKLPPVANLQSPEDHQVQHAQTEVGVTLHGVKGSFATRSPQDPANARKQTWSGWLPHIDWLVNTRLTGQSASHVQLRELVQQGGLLTLESKLDLHDILRPKVQPGSSLDYRWPEEAVSLIVSSSHPMTLSAGGKPVATMRASDGGNRAKIDVSADLAAAFSLAISLEVGAGDLPDLSIAVITKEDERPRALPLNRFYLPWAPDADSLSQAAPIEEIVGGNWGAGRRVFHSEAAGCFKCHAMNGKGPSMGPELGNLVHRDYASVLRDIRHPSFAINPDFLGQTVLLRDGRVLTGVLQNRNGELLLGDQNGKVTRIRAEQMESITPAKVSVMPTGLADKLSADQLRDLMTFLLTPPPQMPLESPLTAPPRRTGAEVAAVLAGAKPLPKVLQTLKIVLVAGKKDHGPGEHDYPAWQQQWTQLLAGAPEVEIETAWDFPAPPQIANADVLVFFQKGAWNDRRQAEMDSFFERGGGAVYIHWAVNGDGRANDFSKRIGLASRGSSIGYRHGPLSLQVHHTDHPIMRNIEPLQLYDESYWRLTGETDDVILLATSVEEGQPRPQIWCYERGAGRAFVSIPGHYSWTFDDPIFRTLLLRGIAWTARQPIDRFNDLVRPGARMSR